MSFVLPTGAAYVRPFLVTSGGKISLTGGRGLHTI